MKRILAPVVMSVLVCLCAPGCGTHEDPILSSGDPSGQTGNPTGNTESSVVRTDSLTSPLQGHQAFYVTSVEDRGNALLLKGVIYDYPVLTPETLEKVKSGESVTLDGTEYWYHAEDDMNIGMMNLVGLLRDKTGFNRLYIVQEEGAFQLRSGAQMEPWGKTDMIRETEVEKTTPCLVESLTDVHTTAGQFFAGFQSREAPDVFYPDQLLVFEFENGKCTGVTVFPGGI